MSKEITVKNNDISNENKKKFLIEETKFDGRILLSLDTKIQIARNFIW